MVEDTQIVQTRSNEEREHRFQTTTMNDRKIPIKNTFFCVADNLCLYTSCDSSSTIANDDYQVSVGSIFQFDCRCAN